MTGFDTHSIVKRLKDAGFTDTQAEAVTDVVREVREQETTDLVTKADLATTKAELQTEFAGIRTEMAELRSDLLRYIVTSLGTGALIFALIKLIPGGH